MGSRLIAPCADVLRFPARDSRGDNTLRILARAKAPWLYRSPLHKNDTSKAVEIAGRFRCALSCEVLRSGDENDHRLRESPSNKSEVWKITWVNR